MNLKLDLRSVSLAFIAIVCADAALCAQNYFASPERLAVISNRRQLASLALTEVAPEYPPVAKVNYVEGTVRLQIAVNDRGHVSGIHVLEGNSVLANAALKAVNLWTFHPLATAKGPSGFNALVKLKFRLRHPGLSLTSSQAEKDFQRQVKPPHAIVPANMMQGEPVVHMRVLVNDEGEVVDRDSSTPVKTDFEAACENLREWTFLPAHWGNLPVASYLDVDVPIGPAPVTRAAASPSGR
jgi:TonB family protein